MMKPLTRIFIATAIILAVMLILVSKAEFYKNLVIHNINPIADGVYQADVVDDMYRVFMRNMGVKIAARSCGSSPELCEISYLTDANRVQFRSSDPRLVWNSAIGTATYKIKPATVGFLCIMCALLGIALLRRGIIFDALHRLSRDVKHDFTLAVSSLGGLRYLLYGFILYNVCRILLTNFNDIIVWDEAVYLNTGRDLVENFELWPYSRGPLIQFVYAVLFGIVSILGFDGNWLLMLSIGGKLLALLLTTFALVITSRRLEHFLPSSVFKGPVFIAACIVFFPLANLVNPSYAIYTLVFSFAFYLLLICCVVQAKLYLVALGIFMGLLGLVRPDVIVILPFVTLVLCAYHWRSGQRYMVPLYTITPAIVIILGYQSLIYMITGVIETGSMVKLYLAFEAAESLRLNGSFSSFIDWHNASKALAESNYGSAESNNHNMFTAISNNPLAFISREILTIKMLPGAIAEAYTFFDVNRAYLLLGGVSAAFFILFRNSKIIFAVSLVCLLNLSLYFITLIYSSYLLLSFSVFALLFAILITTIMGQGVKQKTLCACAILFSLLLNTPALLTMTLIAVMLLNYSTLTTTGIKLAWGGKVKYFGIHNFAVALALALALSGYKFVPIRYVDVTDYSYIYHARAVALSKCADGRLISHTYAFPIFAKIDHLPIDQDLISNIDDINFLRNRKLVSCLYVDKLMIEQNPMNIMFGIKNLIESGRATPIFRSDGAALYRLL